MAVKNRLAALCFARSPRATRALRPTNFRPSGLVALGLAEGRQSYGHGVALSREPPKLQQARSRCWQNDIDIAHCCRGVINTAGERS